MRTRQRHKSKNMKKGHKSIVTANEEAFRGAHLPLRCSLLHGGSGSGGSSLTCCVSEELSLLIHLKEVPAIINTTDDVAPTTDVRLTHIENKMNVRFELVDRKLDRLLGVLAPEMVGRPSLSV